ncbi:MAG: pyridoxal-phosphate dependent enzyme, partial [Gemmatimonadaceae bacterium]
MARLPVTMPLLDRFPGLAVLPRVQLCRLPTPVQRAPAPTDAIWIKRDDLTAPLCGGNKVRALEFLLGNVKPGDTIVAVGGVGSNQVLSTALHAAELGATTIAYRWKHDMNPVADRLAERIAELVPNSSIHRTPVTALAIAYYQSLKPRHHYLPIGASVPLGALGHVNSALELADQVKRGEMPAPTRVVLPLGSGGTTAGLLLGFAIAGLNTEVIGARVGPRLVVNRRNVFSLVRRTSRLIEKVSGERLPDVDPARFRIAQQVYGGSY